MNSPVMCVSDGRSRWNPPFLMTPYVAPRLGQFLEERGINYVDRVGNCFLSLGPTSARVEVGSTSARSPRARFGPKLPGSLCAAGASRVDERFRRTLAENAGVGKTAR